MVYNLLLYQAIEDMGYAAINKIFLGFEKPWWAPDIKGFQLMWSKDSNAVPSHNEVSTKRGSWGSSVVIVSSLWTD
jgi:hypothetical protein